MTSDNKILIAAILAMDLAICNALFFLACHLGLPAGLEEGGDGRQAAVAFSLCYFACAANRGVVLHRRKVQAWQIIQKAVRNMAYAGLLSALLACLGGFHFGGARFFAAFLLVSGACVSAARLAVWKGLTVYRRSEKHTVHAVMMGSTSNNVALYHEMQDDPTSGYTVDGYFDDAPNGQYPAGCPWLGTPSQAVEWLGRNRRVRSLFCCLPSNRKREIVPVIDWCENHLVRFYSVPNVRNYLLNRMHFNMMGDVPYLSLHRNPLGKPENKLLKRTFDVLFSAAFLCTLFPLILLVVSVVTKLTMPGPVFFRQKRNGIDGREFYCLKFRSMRVNSQADTLQATKDDPRKTRWGDIMRRTSIDELPQFVNVLMGDMSVVGPRPHMLRHTEEYSRIIDKYMVRHYVKPGITGWSQVTGFRGETKELSQMEGRIRGDIFYIEHWSFGLDLYIIYRTVANAVRGDKEAY